ncbi:hypothetical protein ND748_16055 [Frankia sp. AiPs1]|uniref:patatin-like phospholipase family protein n=1 Tax=Frankia sp. AiPs1 TaxID=573493 RepID=UPI002042F59F|nr:patatin-like phospholipase family protein [Frankia sp. AiPs1]MCM3923170.1 hypothetical protein [Frankia sp. AiPs1]
MGRSVIDVLAERRRAGSVPGHRTDQHRVALAVEGGGMRGVVSGAMLVALNDLGLAACFDDVYAFSAGALNSAYFVTGASWEALACYYDYLVEPEFLSLKRVLRGRPALSLDFVIEEIMGRRNPLDFQAVLEAGLRLHITVSSVDDIRPNTISGFASREDLRTILRATSCLPIVAGPPVPFHGDRLLDGGVLLAHPVFTAIEDGCTHIVALRTKPADARAQAPGLLECLVARRLDRLRKGLGGAFLDTQRNYVRVQALLEDATAGSGLDRPYDLLDVVCLPGSHRVGRFTRDTGLLFEGIRAGYGAMMQRIEGRSAPTYLRPTLRDPAWVPAQPRGGEPRGFDTQH